MTDVIPHKATKNQGRFILNQDFGLLQCSTKHALHASFKSQLLHMVWYERYNLIVKRLEWCTRFTFANGGYFVEHLGHQLSFGSKVMRQSYRSQPQSLTN